MRTGRAPVYYWDSCAFISLLTGSGRTEEELRGLRAVERLCDDGGCTIVTTSMTVVEVLACKLTPEQEDLFQSLLLRSNVTSVSLTPRIATLAREIRDYYHDRNLKIAVPDSVHLATAIRYSANELHTYDGAGVRQRPTDLLALAQPIAGKYYIAIKRPEPPISEPLNIIETAEVNGTFDFEDLKIAAEASSAKED